jgi:hypothetical protein
MTVYERCLVIIPVQAITQICSVMPRAKIGLYTTKLYALHSTQNLPGEDQITVIARSRRNNFHTTKKQNKAYISWLFKVS